MGVSLNPKRLPSNTPPREAETIWFSPPIFCGRFWRSLPHKVSSQNEEIAAAAGDEERIGDEGREPGPGPILVEHRSRGTSVHPGAERMREVDADSNADAGELPDGAGRRVDEHSRKEPVEHI